VATTLANLLIGFSKEIGDYVAGTTSAAGSTTTTKTTGFAAFADDWFVDQYYYFTAADGSVTAGTVRKISASSTSAGTTTFTFYDAVASSTTSGKAFSIHKFDPNSKIDALNRARHLVSMDVIRQIADETILLYKGQEEYEYPADLMSIPTAIELEERIPADFEGNLLTNSGFEAWGATLPTGWTSSAGTIEQETITEDYDYYVREGNSSAQIRHDGITGGNLIQQVATDESMNGRSISFWVDVYSQVGGTDIGIQATAAVWSTAHGGNGWERLEVTTNAAGFDGGGDDRITFQIRVPVGDPNVFVDNAGAWAKPWPMRRRFTPLDGWRARHDERILEIPRQTGNGRFIRIRGQGVWPTLSTSQSFAVDEPLTFGLYYMAAAELYSAEQGQNVGLNGMREFEQEIARYLMKYQEFIKHPTFNNQRTARPLRSTV